MSDEASAVKLESIEDKGKDAMIKSGTSSEDEATGTIRVSTTKKGSTPPKGVTSPAKAESKSASHSPTNPRDTSSSPTGHQSGTEQTIGADISVKMEPGQPPKLARTSSQKVIVRPTPLFDDLPDMTAAAKNSFQVIAQCIYAAKYLGTTEHAMECDCAEEWGKTS